MDIWKEWRELPDQTLVMARESDRNAYSDKIHAEGHLIHLRFLTETDLIGSFSDDFLLHLKTVHGVDPHHGAKLMPWIPFMGQKIEASTPKLVFLQKIRQELEDAGVYHPFETKRFSEIVAINHPVHSRYPDIRIREVFSWTPVIGEIASIECPDEETQAHSVIESVARLLDEGIPVSAIRIVHANDSDKTRMRIEADLFGFSLTEERHVPLNRFPLIAHLSRQVGSVPLAELAEKAVSGVRSEEERRVVAAFLSILNQYGTEALERHPDLLRYELASRSVGIPSEEGAVPFIGMDDMIPDSDLHYLFMNYCDDLLPAVRIDDDYLTDAEKELIGQPTSAEINDLVRNQTVRLLESIPRLTLFYSQKGSRGETRKADLGLLRPLSTQPFVISARPQGFSRPYDRVLHAKRQFAWERYGIRHEDQNLLRSTHASGWHPYDPAFRGIRAETLKPVLDRGVRLSPSSLETFHQCRFRYFLKYLLRMEPGEASFELALGNMAHFVLSRVFSSDSSVAELAEEYRNQDSELQEATPGFLAELFASRMEVVVDRLRKRREESLFTDFSIEETYGYLYPDDPNFTILGKIDLVRTFQKDSDVFVSVVDYKTGNNAFRTDDFLRGIDIQLVFYLHLLKKTGAIPGMKPAGFHYQPVNLGKWSKDLKKDPIKEKLKMNGMTLNDSEIATALDPQGDVRGLSRKADGAFSARAKVLDPEQMETYLGRMQQFIDKAVCLIRNGSFDITPLPPLPNGGGSESCEYCPHAGICYLADSSSNERESDFHEEEDD